MSPAPTTPAPQAHSLLEASPRARRRHLRSELFTGLCTASTVLVLVPLFSILLYITARGASGLSLGFFTNLPQPVGEPGGGMGNAVVGTLTLILLACLFGLPVGIGAGVYLAEVGRGRLAAAIRFIADVLGGVPSITIGIFVYGLFVVSMGRFSAVAGGFALSIVMLPTVTRTTEELLRMVPSHLREAALSLGVPHWRATLFVMLRTARPGIVTGIMLAIARIAGETAPLLFTAFSSRYWIEAIDMPVASLPVQILAYATSPYEDWQSQAWTGAFVLVSIVFFLNLVARLATTTGLKSKR